MSDDQLDDTVSLWGVPLHEPAEAARPATLPLPETPADDEPTASFLLRGEEPPTDGIYRPRLRGFGDAA
jgi:hypothetical protein